MKTSVVTNHVILTVDFFFFFFFALVTQLLLSKTGITSAYENKNMDFYWPVWYFDS